MGDLFGTRTFFKNSKIEIIPYFPAFRCYSCSRSSPVHVYVCKKVSTSSRQIHCSSKKITHNKFQEAYFTNQIVLTNYSRQIAKSKSNKTSQKSKSKKQIKKANFPK